MATLTYQIPRHALLWLLVAHLAVIIPFVPHVPIWLLMISAACMIWRTMIFLGRWQFPSTFWKLFLLVNGMLAVFVGNEVKMGLATSIGLLILAFSFKLLETHKERDVYLIVLLAYFVVAVQFLYSTSLFSFAYMLLCILLITAALVSLSHNSANKPGRRALKVGAVLMLQSIPLAIVLFIFFPRIAPFISFDAALPGSKTGLSDQMTPGDVSALSRSNALAFRAEFKGKIPSAEQLYWRSIVLSRFNGRTWSIDPELIQSTGIIWQPRAISNSVTIANNVHSVEYSVLLEPTQTNYLVGLDLPVSLTEQVGITHDFTMISRKVINAQFKYALLSFFNYQLDIDLPTWIYNRETELPLHDDNVRARALAQQWMTEAHGDPAVYINRILNWFRQDNFFYTLTPGALPDHTIDRFLFDRKAGFCAHYAGAFIYLLRAAGIPARMVVGYQGGEINPLGHYVLVHQYDAHAWAEVWLENRGWIRIDPTAFVAPERIMNGAEALIAQQENKTPSNALDVRRYWTNPLVREIRLSLDYVNYTWNQNIVGYNQQSQEKLLSGRFNLTSLYQRVAWMMSLLGILIVVVAAYLFRSKSSAKKNPLDQAYLRFCRRMAGLGIIRQQGEAPSAFCRRIQQTRPELSTSVIEITDLYMHYQYQLIERRKKNQQAIARQMKKAMGALV